METNSVVEYIPPIMTLPREVRAVIYNKLSEVQLTRLRLVCQQWSQEIDDLCDFSVEIDDRKPFLQRILQLRIKSCSIVHFLVPPPTGMSNTYLLHPNLLRSLHILSDQISSDNFFSLIGDSAQYLNEFSVFLNSPLISNVYPFTLSNVRFEKLQKLCLILSTVSATDGGPFRPRIGPMKSEDIIFSQILDNPMQNLKNLKIEVRCVGISQVSRFSSLIYAFLARHWKTLNVFDLELIQGHGMPLAEAKALNESDSSIIDFTLLKKLVNLNSVRVINSTSIGIDVLAHLLALQTKIEYFESDILPISNAVFKEIICKNYNTLVQVDISDVSVWTEDDSDPFDLTVFQNCSSLKKLTLDRNAVQRRQFECAELINLFNLPGSIEELAFNYFLLLSDELLMYFDTTAAENLQSVSLTQSGITGDYGVDGSVLEKIICLPKVIFIEISTLNYSDVGERIKLNLILNTFGYTNDRPYFQLSKIGSQLQSDWMLT